MVTSPSPDVRARAVTTATRLIAAHGFEATSVQAVADGAPIVSFTVEGYAPADVATVLETAAGVQVRSGFHCAALIHEHLGTKRDGTVRASFGPFSTAADVATLVETIAELAG